MAAHGVEAQPRRAAVVGFDQRRRAGQDVLEDGQAMVEMPLELHAELGQRTAGHHRHPAEHAGGDEARRHHQRRHGSGAEVLHVGARCPGQAGRLGHRLGHVAAAALVAVADRLLAAAEHELDRLRVDAVAVEEVEQRQRGRRLRGQVLQDDGGGEGVVVVVGRRTTATPEAGRLAADGQRAGFGGDGFGIAGVAGDPVEIEPLGERVAGEGSHGGVAGGGREGHEVEGVGRRQQAEKLGLRHDLAIGAEAEISRSSAVPAAAGIVAAHGRGGRARGWQAPMEARWGG